MRPMLAERWPDVALQVFLILVAAVAAYVAVRIAVAAAVKHLIARRTDVKKVVITAETIEHGQPPMLVTETDDAEPRRRGTKERTAERASERQEESA